MVSVAQKGYGSALYHGTLAAQGEWIIMGDSDDSYDFSALDLFVGKLREGYDLVMGNRFKGGIRPGAMPWKNRYVGNPVLSWIGRVLFHCPAGDFHCGLRGFRKDAFHRMDLRTTGMEFASEMVIKATLFRMRICEVPTTLSPDGRSRPPHLRPWRDGWRHLRFMLLFSPRWLFLMPGAALTLVSAMIYGLLYFGPVHLGGIVFDIHTLLFAEAGVVFGSLMVSAGLLARMFGMREGLLQRHGLLEWAGRSPVLEMGGSIGLLFLGLGLLIGATAFSDWATSGFGAMIPGDAVRRVSFPRCCFPWAGSYSRCRC